jgi:hypothetical protein
MNFRKPGMPSSAFRVFCLEGDIFETSAQERAEVKLACDCIWAVGRPFVPLDPEPMPLALTSLFQ